MFMEQEVMVEWVTKQFEVRLDPLEDSTKKRFQEIDKQVNWILEDNLKVPGLFGKPAADGSEPKYENLGDCLQALSVETKEAV